MNNLKYYDTSLAYNFEMFAEKPKADVIPMPERKRKNSRKKHKARALAGKGTIVLLTVFILGMLCGNLFLRSKITETRAKIDKINKQISEMDSEQTRLNVIIGNKLSYTNLEEEAYMLGMRKMDKNQVIYIKSNNTNKAITQDGVQFAENN